MEDIRFLSKYLALVVLIYGLYNYKNYANTKAKYFIFSILYAVLTEFFGSNFHKWFGIVNYPVYNVFIIVQLSFYLWWFQTLLESLSRKKIVRLSIFIYLTFSLLNIIYWQDFFLGYQTYTYGIGVILVLLSICFYFIETFNKDTILSITDSVLFWFALGVLLFYGTFMPFMFASKLFLTIDKWIYSLVVFVLNVIMYSCFAVGFYKSYKNIKESTSL
ncbi:hypothetical protein [Kordia sp.]|uniref:hypothetical protein n=1 Tax=Kordia sp. TaxID=1965332 RepID=UPI003B5A5AE6